jgi:hypothetical protein
MEKAVIFISHIEPEKAIATEFKLLIEHEFLGLIDVFVSSDGQSIQMGQRWLDGISEALKKCKVEIVVCSPVSIKKPWINFEAGAGWIRDIPVIPLCHSGMTPSSLPVPLSLLQAAQANEVSGLKLILPVLAQALGAKTPNTDFTAFIQTVKSFESQYTFWNEVKAAFQVLANIVPNLKLGVNPVAICVPDYRFFDLVPPMQFLESNNIIRLQRGGTALTSEGVFFNCDLIPLADFLKTIQDPNFRL